MEGRKFPLHVTVLCGEGEPQTRWRYGGKSNSFHMTCRCKLCANEAVARVEGDDGNSWGGGDHPPRRLVLPSHPVSDGWHAAVQLATQPLSFAWLPVSYNWFPSWNVAWWDGHLWAILTVKGAFPSTPCSPPLAASLGHGRAAHSWFSTRPCWITSPNVLPTLSYFRHREWEGTLGEFEVWTIFSWFVSDVTWLRRGGLGDESGSSQGTFMHGNSEGRQSHRNVMYPISYTVDEVSGGKPGLENSLRIS